MNIIIIDDNELWIEYGKTLLEQGDFQISGLVVADPEQFTTKSLPPHATDALKKADVLLVDKDFGKSVTSTRLVCVVKHNFPELPVIRWTAGYESSDDMKHLGVTCINKPNKKNEGEFLVRFTNALNEQRRILSGPMEIFDTLDETARPIQFARDRRSKQLSQIAQIALLADNDTVPSTTTRCSWAITGEDAYTTKHELGHCICDGSLTVEDIKPHLPNLQKVIAKFEAAGEIDDRFKICAQFIKDGKLEEFEFVRRCY